jgi:uncharacterized membrane protein YcaP (DUF421 family)
MGSVLGAASLYLAMLVMVRLSGRRSLGQLTPFDFILLLLIGEAAQQALVGDDGSFTNAILVIMTLLTIDIGLSLLKRHSPLAGRLIEGVPTVLVEDGRVLEDRLRAARITHEDVLQAARAHAGLMSLSEIRHAVLETDGKISIVPHHAQAGGPVGLPP